MLEKMFEMVKSNVIKELEETGFIFDGDNSERIVDNEIERVIEENSKTEDELTDNMADYYDKIEEMIKKFLKENYKEVGECDVHGFYRGYYYLTKYSFSSVEELENFFGIRE